MYAPFECGMKSGTARVYDHEIPGGQYSNLMVQCQAMGIWDRWEEVLNAYRDVNALLGDVVKVSHPPTFPSSHVLQHLIPTPSSSFIHPPTYRSPPPPSAWVISPSTWSLVVFPSKT